MGFTSVQQQPPGVPGLEGAPIALAGPANDTAREVLLAWTAARIPHMTAFDPAKAYPIEVRRGGERVACAVFHEWRDSNVELSMAATTPRWATRVAISAILSWPFLVLGVQRITTITPVRNVRAIRLDEGLGFVHEGVMRRAFANDDAVVMGFTVDDWLASRWCTAKEC